jgi:hypothetical protein
MGNMDTLYIHNLLHNIPACLVTITNLTFLQSPVFVY